MSHPNAAQATLDDMLMYRLYQAWFQSSPVFVRLCEGRFGITRREWRVLACAVEHGPMTSADLAATAKLDLARTSRTLGVLCEKGWLRRVQEGDDRRVVQVEATDGGHDCYDALMPEVQRLNDLLTQDLTADEVAQLRTLLARVEQRGLAMSQQNLVSEKASRRSGGTRRVRA
ncbi:MarR family transcriptional regulator [Bordetella ansorpii]|uniref:MarR family transcriptional regulator n=1 Tax=Bordetella ansorpii TaxID=288768 RepID=A0A157QYI2_9BORD|nr:MarR family winged helix-turn-helix transcriptional regulator [Bordetella ansorpii]SAI49989.1 MarR family transcriptional regulator [Bordetella ansorpii]